MDYPTISQIENEYRHEVYKRSFAHAMRSTLYSLITIAAVAVLVAVLLLPVLQLYGTSMEPTLEEGDIVVSLKGAQFKTGDVVAFYYNNRILVKRVIANAGDWVDIAEDGTVSVNQQKLYEPYVTDLAVGECDIALPYQVPEGRVFVMGDHRNVSIDSRSTTIGCVAKEQLVGKIVFRLWPMKDFGPVAGHEDLETH